jgi:hypothetical protein
VEKPEEERPLGNIDVSRRIILRGNLEIYGGVLWAGLIWLRIRTSGGLL